MLLTGMKLIGAGLATISIGGAGVGIGTVWGCCVLATAQNHRASQYFFTYTILGFALTEAIALFGLMMAFLIMFGF